jgi:hypothetical protein
MNRLFLLLASVVLLAFPVFVFAKTTVYGVISADSQTRQFSVKDIKTKKFVPVPALSFGFASGKVTKDTTPDIIATYKRGAVIVTQKALNQIPLYGKATAAGVKFAKTYAGKLLITSPKDTRVWFVDPETATRVYVEIDKNLRSLMWFDSFLAPRLFPDEYAKALKDQKDAVAAKTRKADAKDVLLDLIIPRTEYEVGDAPTGTYRLRYSGMPANVVVATELSDIDWIAHFGPTSTFANTHQILLSNTSLPALKEWSIFSKDQTFPIAMTYSYRIAVFSCADVVAKLGTCDVWSSSDAENLFHKVSSIADRSVVFHVRNKKPVQTSTVSMKDRVVVTPTWGAGKPGVKFTGMFEHPSNYVHFQLSVRNDSGGWDAVQTTSVTPEENPQTSFNFSQDGLIVGKTYDASISATDVTTNNRLDASSLRYSPEDEFNSAVLTFSADKKIASVGDSVHLNVHASPIVGSTFIPDRLEIYWQTGSTVDDLHWGVLKSCPGTSLCETDFIIPSGNISSYQFYGRLVKDATNETRDSDGVNVAIRSQPVSQAPTAPAQTIAPVVQTSAPPLVTLPKFTGSAAINTDPTNPKPQNSFMVIGAFLPATDNEIALPESIEVYVDSVLVKACSQALRCSAYIVVPQGRTTAYQSYARVLDSNGRVMTSDTKMNTIGS